MKQFNIRIPPAYERKLLILTLAVNMTVYMGCRAVNQNRTHYIISLPLDRYIPLCTFFVIFYVGAFLQWILGYLLAGNESRKICTKMAAGDIIAKMLCAVIFLLLPTTMNRTPFEVKTVFDRLTAFIYSVDLPDNLLPSIHCLESWMCLRGSFWLKKVPSWYRGVSIIFSLMVFASTVLLHQHLLIDIPAGIAAAEIGIRAADMILKQSEKR